MAEMVFPDQESETTENLMSNLLLDFAAGHAADSNNGSAIINGIVKNAKPVFGGSAVAEGSILYIANQGEKYNKIYDFSTQRLTPTHAKMWMPSMGTSMNNSIHKFMGGKKGVFESKYFYAYKGEDLEDQEQLLSNPDAAKIAPPEYGFKYSNLVSAMKLVPYGVSEDQLNYYIDNPNETINVSTKKVFDFVLHVVPDNVRYAGPKPATKEPNSLSLVLQTKPEACEIPSRASTLQRTIVTGKQNQKLF